MSMRGIVSPSAAKDTVRELAQFSEEYAVLSAAARGDI